MKVYKVKVNGKVYEVELESVSEVAGSIATPVAEQAATQAAQTPVVAGAGAQLNAPMAGTILDVKVKVGDSVQVGDVVCILEAMKLENEVPATAEGIVKEIKVNNGDSVNNSDVLIVLG